MMSRSLLLPGSRHADALLIPGSTSAGWARSRSIPLGEGLAGEWRMDQSALAAGPGEGSWRWPWRRG